MVNSELRNMYPTESLKAKSSSVIPEPKLFLSLLQFSNMVIPLQTASSGVEGLFCIARSQRTFFSGKTGLQLILLTVT